MVILAHPSTANPILHAYRRRGVILSRDGDVLVVRPADRLADADDVELAAHKAALLALRACPILWCGQLLPWGEDAGHPCREDASTMPTQTNVERREEAA